MKLTVHRRGWRFAIRLMFGMGAGYIGGWTAYLAWDSAPYRYAKYYRGGRGPDGRRVWKLQFALVERNANRVPFVY